MKAGQNGNRGESGFVQPVNMKPIAKDPRALVLGLAFSALLTTAAPASAMGIVGEIVMRSTPALGGPALEAKPGRPAYCFMNGCPRVARRVIICPMQVGERPAFGARSCDRVPFRIRELGPDRPDPATDPDRPY